ncbi:MAG: HAD family hydrolase [Clostridiales bacterium]|nr:HAD family hydrolase [Clostridiales bacterium]
MANNYKAILFDLDGTLLDTLEDLTDSMNSALKAAGLPQHNPERYKYFIGAGVRNLVCDALPPEMRTPENIEKFRLAMRAEYKNRWNKKSRPFPGVEEMLDKLAASGLRFAVLSNKVDDLTKMVISSLLPKWIFEVVFGERLGVPIKPNPAAAFEIVKIMNLKPGDFLYLGDGEADMKTARAAGIFACGVLWGYRTADELKAAGAQVLVSTPAEVLSLI